MCVNFLVRTVSAYLFVKHFQNNLKFFVMILGWSFIFSPGRGGLWNKKSYKAILALYQIQFWSVTKFDLGMVIAWLTSSEFVEFVADYLSSLMAISKENVARDCGENLASKSVCRSLHSPSEFKENAMENPTNGRPFSNKLTTVDPLMHPWLFRWHWNDLLTDWQIADQSRISVSVKR